MGTRSAHERGCSRDEHVHHHRGCECTIASPAETAARGALRKRNPSGMTSLTKRTKNACSRVPAETARIQTITCCSMTRSPLTLYLGLGFKLILCKSASL